MLLIFILLLLVFILAAVAFLVSGNKNLFYNRPQKLAQKEVTIDNETFQAEVADTAISRAAGLSGRDSLAENSAMLFLFNNAGKYGFWMKGMKFPIDIVWIKDGRIAGFSENLQPPGASVLSLKVYYPPEPIDEVLEINAGLVQKYGWQIGDAAEVK